MSDFTDVQRGKSEITARRIVVRGVPLFAALDVWQELQERGRGSRNLPDAPLYFIEPCSETEWFGDCATILTCRTYRVVQIEVTQEVENVSTGFGTGDVTALFDIEEKDALSFLDRNGKHIQEAMTMAGWAAIESLGNEEDLSEVTQ